jgi:hypothetical protein
MAARKTPTSGRPEARPQMTREGRDGSFQPAPAVVLHAGSATGGAWPSHGALDDPPFDLAEPEGA